MYELIILGGGPAGVAAAVYAARKRIKAAIITEEFGGQSMVSEDVQNWIGEPHISGLELAKKFKAHVEEHKEHIDILDGERVAKISREGADGLKGHFIVETESGKKLESKTLLYTIGSKRRRLGVPGEDQFDGKGVVFCSTCDAPLFKDMDIAVIGGGNAGLEAVVDSIPYAKKIYLIVRSDQLKGDPVTQEKVKGHQKVEIIYNANTTEILGEKMVSGLKYTDAKTGEEKQLELQGVFVEIGAVPNSDLVKGLVELNERREITVNHQTQQSSLEGLWAAGDVSDVLYKQNNSSAGDAVKAILNIYEYLHKNEAFEAHQ
ncbi:MAG: FAD-dependent oxidoreductase [Candidatus Harrisonbacteria bacterium]|nr:FAD-dependent oxidoreductase [Candidatus Harrisonbacteria bacterium]